MSSVVIWATVGMGLILAEVFTSTFVLLFFGVAALVVSGLKAVGLENLPLEIALFGLIGILGTLFLRKKIRDSLKGHGAFKTDRYVFLDQDIPARGMASIAYQGSTWTAINDSDVPLAKGTKVAILRTEGVTLFVRAED